MKNYFKKFSIMFVMLLTVIGVGVIQNGTVTNAATVGELLTAPESGWQRYDDANSKIVVDGNRYPAASGYNVYNLTTSAIDINKIMKFKFYGTKLRILQSTWSSIRSDKVLVYVDSKLIGTYSAVGVNTGSSLMCEVLNLSPGTHQIEIVNNGTIAGNMFSLDAIDIDDTGKLIDPNESISLSQLSINLTVGDSQKLTATTTPAAIGVTWTSSDPLIATVDSTGKVTGVKEGQATITATTADGLTSTCVVNVANKTVPVEPTPTESEYIVNTARAKGDNTNNASGGVSIIYKGVAEVQLSVVKTADVQSVFVGDNFTYTLVVTNTSSQIAKAVVINDSAPNHIQFTVSGVTTTQGKVDPSSTSKNIIVNVGDIPPSGTVTIKIPATVIL